MSLARSLRWRAALLLLGLVWSSPAAAFETNGRHWDSLPVVYYINPAGCPVLPTGEDIVEVIALAVANWCDPVCSAMEFQYLGPTDLTWGADGQNTIFCVDHDWNFSPGAAGASIQIPTEPGEPLEVDLALNAADLEWAMGGGDATRGDIVDPVAVATHEIGHWIGMSHSPDPFASMYYAMLPNGLGATLTADDVAGVCSLYPSGVDECQVDGDCPDEYTCVTIQDIPVCQEPHDGPGSFCSKDHIECAQMCWVSFMECGQTCLFTEADYSDGYCAPLCDDEPCPWGFECRYIEQYDVSICFEDPDAEDGGTDGDSDGGLDGEDDGSADGQDDAGLDGDLDEPGDAGPDGDDDAGPDAGEDGADQAGPDGGQDDDEDDSSDGGGCSCSTPKAHPGHLTLVFLLAWVLVLRRRF